MKVSIIVPIYNVEQYIKRCFNSITSQTFCNSELECIFVDDVSPDNCNSILKQLIRDYNGEISFRIIKHKQNLGLSGARNTGLKEAIGEYVYFLDSDDDIPSDSIFNLVEILNDSKENIEMIQGSTKILKGNTIETKYYLDTNITEVIRGNKHAREIILGRKAPVTAWNRLLLRRFLVENNLFFKQGIIHEDEYWNYFLADKISLVSYCKKITYNHYINPNSIMTSNQSKSIDNWLIIVECLLNDEVVNKDKLCYRYIFESAFVGAFLKSFQTEEDKSVIQDNITKLKIIFQSYENEKSGLLIPNFKLFTQVYRLPFFMQLALSKPMVRSLYTKVFLRLL